MNSLPIALETKDLVGLFLLLFGTVALTSVLTIWPKLRSPALFIMAAGTAATTYFDLNIFSAYWYRGTTRGFEVTGFDVFAIALLLSSIIAPKSEGPRWFWPASLGLMLVYLGYCVVNSLLSTPFIFGLYEASKFARGIIYFLAAAVYLRDEKDLSILVAALATMVCLEAAHALRARYLFGEYRPGGTLDHPNSLSMYLCLVTPVLISAACSTLNVWLRRFCWVAVLAACVAMVLTLSRAGLPIFAAVVLGTLLFSASWRPSPAHLLGGFLALTMLTGVVIKAWPHITARYGQATLQEEYFDAPGESRGYYFRQAQVILEHQPFGVGLNNWSYWVSREYGKPLGMTYENYDNIVYAPPTDLMPMYRFAAPAHNLGVLTVGELGWAGLALLIVLWLRWLVLGAGFLFSRRPEAMHRLGIGIAFGILGTFLHSFTEWTFRQTPIYLTFCVLAGTLAMLHARKRAEQREAAEAGTVTDEAWLEEPAAAAHYSPSHN